MDPISPQIKVCGLTREEDVAFCLAQQIHWIGFNFVSWSKRFVDPALARKLWVGALQSIPALASKDQSHPIAVVANHRRDELEQMIIAFPELQGVQFHGGETSAFIADFRVAHPDLFIIKAVPVADISDIARLKPGSYGVNLILFDTALPSLEGVGQRLAAEVVFPPKISGGAGRPFPWEWLASCAAGLAFGVAGGVGPHNASDLMLWHPQLIDLNSGVEDFPGRKSPKKIASTLQAIRINNEGRS